MTSPILQFSINLNSRDKAHATDIALELGAKGRPARRDQTSGFYSSGKEVRYEEGRFPCGNCEFDAATYDLLEAHCREVHRFDLGRLLAMNGVDASQAVVGLKAFRAGRFLDGEAVGTLDPCCRRARVTIKLSDDRATGPEAVLDVVRQLAAERGLVVTGCDFAGRIPFEVLVSAGRHYLRQQGKSPFVPVSDLLGQAVASMGLAEAGPFVPAEKVADLPQAPESALVRLSCAEFADEVSRDTPAPGGGSIAALAGALGAGLAAMVANLTQGRYGPGLKEDALLSAAAQSQRLKEKLLLAVDDDTNAFNAYMAARRLSQGSADERQHRLDRMQEGLKEAVAVPWSTAGACLEVMRAAELALTWGNPASMTDAMVGVQMGFTGVRGGIWNVLINLKDITDPAFVQDMEDRCGHLLEEARGILESAMACGDSRLAGLLHPERK